MAIKRTKGEVTRGRIVEAAVAAFGRKGYFDASLDEIARAAKVQRPAIINYFGSKLGLYRACVDDVMREFGARYAESHSPTDDAIARLDLNFELNLEMGLRRPHHAKLIVLLYYGATVNEELREVYLETLAGIRARYHGFLEAAVRERALPRGADLPRLGALLHEAIMGMMINFVATGKKSEAAAMRAKWETLKDSLLGVRG